MSDALKIRSMSVRQPRKTIGSASLSEISCVEAKSSPSPATNISALMFVAFNSLPSAMRRSGRFMPVNLPTKT